MKEKRKMDYSEVTVYDFLKSKEQSKFEERDP